MSKIFPRNTFGEVLIFTVALIITALILLPFSNVYDIIH